MARDLNDPWAEIRALKERVRILEAATPLQDASVTRGRLRVASDDGLVVQQTPTGGAGIRVTGLQIVDGTLRISGTLEGGGTFTWTGSLTNNGPLVQNGTWTLAGVGTISGNTTGTGTLTWTGPWNLNGTGVIAGNVTQTGTYQVNSPGTIKVGSAMTLTPATDGGAVVFSDGSKMSNNASSIGFTKGSNSIRVGDSTAGLLAGSNSVTVSGTGVQINLAAIPTENTSGNPTNTLSITAGGFLRRAV